MADPNNAPMSDKRLAELHALVDHGVDMQALEWSLEPTLTDMEAGIQQLLAEVERLRAREAATMQIIERLAALHGDQDWIGDDEYGGWGWLTERIEPLVNQARTICWSRNDG